MTEGDPLQILPYDIQAILKRKSSRDPSSRFSSKLHILLNYVNEHPDLDEKIGCSWVTDEEFRINKRTLVNIMGIKINTLNVNLHDLGFKQQKHNKDGWTLWKKDGFSRNSTDYTETVQAAANAVSPKPKGFALNFNLGKTCPKDFDAFKLTCSRIWTDITQSDDRPVATNIFIQNAAARFKQPEQPLDNAQEVLQAIISPQRNAPYVTYTQFCKFMAMFGPEDTIMLKIASLLSCSNNSGQWLIFDPSNTPGPFCGSFEDQEPNRLVLRCTQSITITTQSVWNMPLISAKNNYNYICDEKNCMYRSWEDYFHQYPFPGNNYMASY